MTGDEEEGTRQARYLWVITDRSFSTSGSEEEGHGGAAKVMAAGLDGGDPWYRALAKITEESRSQCRTW